MESRLVSPLLLLSALLVAGLADPLAARKHHDRPAKDPGANFNEIFDSVLPTIRTWIATHGLDPLEMDDISERLPGISCNTSLRLTNGRLRGLSEVTRSADVFLTYENKLLTLDASVAVANLDVNYEYVFRGSLATRRGDILGRVDRMEARLVAAMDFEQRKILLLAFKTLRVRKVELKVAGTVVDPALNAALKAFTTVFRRSIMLMVDKECTKMLQTVIDKINAKIPRPNEIVESGAAFADVPLPLAFPRT